MSLVAEKAELRCGSQRIATGAVNSLPAMILALLATALLLRVWELGNLPGINADEAWSGVQAQRLLSGETIAWRTPTGNPINVFFLAPLVLLHMLLAPSIALLRSVAVASGVAAIAVNYLLCRRVFDRNTAIVSTVLLALLPINIAYSRFAWDASQSLLFTLPVLYCSLAWFHRVPARHFPWAATAALLAAIVVHPTNVFAAPLVVVPVAIAHRDWLLHSLRRTRVPARPVSLACLMIASVLGAYLAWTLLAIAVQRVHGPAEFVPFAANYLKLLSGATVYEFIAGTANAAGPLAWLPAACNLALGLLLIVAGCGWHRRLAAAAQSVDICLLCGAASVAFGFVVVAGAGAIAPHFERYGICLVGPACLVIARGLSWWIEPGRAHARVSAWLLASAAWLLPLSFWLGYFVCIETTGGLSHRAFRTAQSEPKQAALEWILSQRDPKATTEIVVSQWWLYWPLEYLSAGQPQLAVRDSSGEIDRLAPLRPAAQQRFHVEFAETPAERRLLEQFERTGDTFERHVETDFAQRPLLHVYSPRNSADTK